MVARSFTPTIRGKIRSFLISAITQLPIDLLLAPVLQAMAGVSLLGRCRSLKVVEIPPAAVFSVDFFPRHIMFLK